MTSAVKARLEGYVIYSYITPVTSMWVMYVLRDPFKYDL
jgi:hypothetical protein